jgi:hypothetical protein
MKLESARELKQSLGARLLPQIQTTITARAAFGRATVPLGRVAGPPASVALGVAPAGRSYRLAVRVQKRAFQESRELDFITKQAKGEVDLRYVGRISKRTAARPWYQERQRPLLIGCSIGHFAVTAGTLGCFVRPVAGGAVSLLSNNHVLANENRAKRGDAIVQPGVYDGGSVTDDVVAKLGDFVRVRKSGTNFVDCALGEIVKGVTFDETKLRGLGKLAGLGAAFLDAGSAVAKLGRTTGVTRGKVTAFEMDNVVIGYDVGNLRFDNQVEIESDGKSPFSDGGDSGSLIVDGDKRGVALLFAGSDQGGSNGQGLTYANPLGAVLDALKVELLP